MKKFFAEFKEFIAKGSVIDMAVAVVIGGAFSKIVASLVADVIMPLVSLILGGIDVTDWKWVIRPATATSAEAALTYGNFIQTILEFFIVAFSIFLMLKIVLTLKERMEKVAEKVKEDLKLKEQAEQAAEEAATETTEDILKDIRNLLEAQKKAE